MNFKSRLALVLIGISTLLIIFDRAGKLNAYSFPVRRILSPLQQIYNGLLDMVTAPVSFFQFVQSGEQRIIDLENKNLVLTSQVQKLKVLQEENSDLKKQLGVYFFRSRILLPAKVLGIGRNLEIEIADNSKLRPGQAVVYLDNYVGQITKTGWGIAFVKLVSDPDSRVAAKSPNASGVVTGEFSFGVTLDKVAKSETFFLGEFVVTSGLEGSIPPGLMIGKIDRIEPTPNDLFQRATLSLQYDIKKLRNVYVVID